MTGAQTAGVDPGFMLAMAKQESGFNPNAKAPTSSATGLYQFTRGTWRTMVDKYGAQYGIGLGDINDPKANAIMGGLYAKDNKAELENSLGIHRRADRSIFCTFSRFSGCETLYKWCDAR
jgi:soluble lytic murein transglycosylase-like protein